MRPSVRVRRLSASLHPTPVVGNGQAWSRVCEVRWITGKQAFAVKDKIRAKSSIYLHPSLTQNWTGSMQEKQAGDEN